MWVMTEKFGESLENEKKPCAWRVLFESEPVGNPTGSRNLKGVRVVGPRPPIHLRVSRDSAQVVKRVVK